MMSLDNVKKFEELLRSSSELQAELKAAADAYEGDTNDGKAIFDATVGKVAEGAGLAFTYDEAHAAVAAAEEISDAELDAVAGGGWCFVIGGQDGTDCDCVKWHGGYACSYVGITADV